MTVIGSKHFMLSKSLQIRILLMVNSGPLLTSSFAMVCAVIQFEYTFAVYLRLLISVKSVLRGKN